MKFMAFIFIFLLFCVSHAQTSKNPAADNRFLIYDTTVARPVLSSDLGVAKNQAKRFCRAFISEFEAAFYKKAAKSEPNTFRPFEQFCPKADEFIDKATNLNEIDTVIVKMDERANQTAYFYIARKFESDEGFYQIQKEIKELKESIVQLKEKNIAGSSSSASEYRSVLTSLGMRPSAAQFTESILVIIALIGLVYVVFTGRQ